MNPGTASHERIPEQYITLDSFELGWTKSDLATLRKMWKEDKPIEDIVYTLRPSEKGSFEVALAIIDQLYRGYIQPRQKHLIIGGLQ
jgi:hypothetical protein